MLLHKILLAAIAVLALSVSAFGTDVTLSASVIPSANWGNLGPSRSVTVTATSGSPTVTSSAAFPSYLTGITGWALAINGSNYTVSTSTSQSSITLSSNFSGSTASYTATIYPLLLLRVFSDKAFTPLGASYVVQAGQPSNANGFFVQYGCSIISGSLYIPAVVLPSMLDSATAYDRSARYSAFFFTVSGARLQPYYGFESFQVPASPTTTTWPTLAIYNAPSSTYQLDMYTYSRDQIAALLAYLSTTTITTSGLATGYVAKTANYTLTSTDFGVDCTSGTFTITLPTAVGCTGRLYAVKNSGSGTITLATTSGELIDGYSSGNITLITYDSMLLQSTGTGWRILSYS